jgi:protein-tyrosine phosphatase
MVASLLAQRVPGLLVASAGTAAVVGSMPHPNTATVLAERGVPLLAHRARQITPAIARGAGLIVSMTRAHRGFVVGLGVESFTLLELSRLLGSGGTGTARDVAAIAAARLAAEDRDHDHEDVEDPIGLPLEAYDRCFDVVSTGIDPLVRALGGS